MERFLNIILLRQKLNKELYGLFYQIYLSSQFIVTLFYEWLMAKHTYPIRKWKHFPRYWRFVRGIHRWPANSSYKGHWHGALMFSLISAWTNVWVNNREARDLRRHDAHYDVIVMFSPIHITPDITPYRKCMIHLTVFIEYDMDGRRRPLLHSVYIWHCDSIHISLLLGL